MKRLFSILLLIALTLTLAACGQTASASVPASAGDALAPAATAGDAQTATAGDAAAPLRIGALTGPTALGMLRLFDNPAYDITLAGAADELTPKLLQGELDAAALPVNLGAVLYGKSGGAVEMACVNTLGVLTIVEKGGEEIQTLADLAGKTLYATGKGAAPEYTLRYLLGAAELDADKDVDIQWKSEPAEVTALLSTQERGCAMLPQPYATAALGALEGTARLALSLNDAWEALDNGCLLVTAGLVIRRDYAEAYPEELARFLADYQESVAWVNANNAAAAALCGDLGIIKAAVAEKAIPACNVTFLAGAELRAALEGFLGILYAQNPASVGGAMPGDDFYYGA